MAQNFPDLIQDMNQHFQEAQQTPRIINTKRSTQFETYHKTVKRQSLESGKRQVTHFVQGILDKIPPSFPAETIEARSQWDKNPLNIERKKKTINQ